MGFFHKLLLGVHEKEWIRMRTGNEDTLQQEDGKRKILYHKGEGGGRKLLDPGSYANTIRNLLLLGKAR